MPPTMSTTKRYFYFRNKSLSKEKKRDNLAQREIITMRDAFEANGISRDIAGKTIVDLACGDQYLKSTIQNMDGHYVGIDIEQCDLSQEVIPLEDESADICLSMAFIEHILDPGNFLQECRRILKKNGSLWLETPNINRARTKFWDDPTHIHPYTPESLRTVLKMNGFKVLMVTPNYRCKPINYYKDDASNFWKSRIHMRLAGTSMAPVPNFFKGRCTGIFALAIKDGNF